jgi:hypothetical protein
MASEYFGESHFMFIATVSVIGGIVIQTAWPIGWMPKGSSMRSRREI